MAAAAATCVGMTGARLGARALHDLAAGQQDDGALAQVARVREAVPGERDDVRDLRLVLARDAGQCVTDTDRVEDTFDGRDLQDVADGEHVLVRDDVDVVPEDVLRVDAGALRDHVDRVARLHLVLVVLEDRLLRPRRAHDLARSSRLRRALDDRL